MPIYTDTKIVDNGEWIVLEALPGTPLNAIEGMTFADILQKIEFLSPKDKRAAIEKLVLIPKLNSESSNRKVRKNARIAALNVLTRLERANWRLVSSREFEDPFSSVPLVPLVGYPTCSTSPPTGRVPSRHRYNNSSAANELLDEWRDGSSNGSPVGPSRIRWGGNESITFNKDEASSLCSRSGCRASDECNLSANCSSLNRAFCEDDGSDDDEDDDDDGGAHGCLVLIGDEFDSLHTLSAVECEVQVGKDDRRHKEGKEFLPVAYQSELPLASRPVVHHGFDPVMLKLAGSDFLAHHGTRDALITAEFAFHTALLQSELQGLSRVAYESKSVGGEVTREIPSLSESQFGIDNISAGLELDLSYGSICTVFEADETLISGCGDGFDSFSGDVMLGFQLNMV